MLGFGYQSFPIILSHLLAETTRREKESDDGTRTDGSLGPFLREVHFGALLTLL